MSKDMTLPQINKFLGNLRAMLEKSVVGLPSEAVQAVLGDPDFAVAQLALFRERVEARSGLIVRDFAVDPTIVGMDAINATRRAFYGDKDVVGTMPHATVPNGQLHFFQTGRYTPVGELEAEYAKRELVACDPHTLCAFNAANPEFADTHPNGTQWKDAGGNFCYAVFNRWDVERRVSVSRSGDDWSDGWWFAGFSK